MQARMLGGLHARLQLRLRWKAMRCRPLRPCQRCPLKQERGLCGLCLWQEETAEGSNQTDIM